MLGQPYSSILLLSPIRTSWRTPGSAAPCPALPCLLIASCQAGLVDKMKARAASRKLEDLTIGPVLSWTTQAMMDHMNKLLDIPGEKCGARQLQHYRVGLCGMGLGCTDLLCGDGALQYAMG